MILENIGHLFWKYRTPNLVFSRHQKSSINPKIISYSEKTKKGFEGCLSIPGLRALVPRFIETKISFLNREGNSQTKIFKDIVSRIFQHELDHLEGVLYIDKVENTKEIYTDKEYQKMIAKK